MGNLFGGGSGKATIGYRYYMSLFMGLCRGPIDSIEEIRIGDRTAWPKAKGQNGTSDPINDTGLTQIKAGDLFGGDKREGGVEGPMRVYMGKPNQTLPARLKALIGGRVPEMRGVVTIWFDGLIASLNPYPKTWSIRVRRTINGWNGKVWRPGLAVIWLHDRDIKAYNGAHILYEAATNYDWGKNLSRSVIDDKVWTEAATRLKKENFGLCLAYRRDGDLDEFVSTVLDHIGGTIYTDRETGLLNLKLIRNDYRPGDLTLYGYDSGLLSITEDVQNVPLQTVNEVIVNYRHTPSNKDRQTRAQNLASIQQIGRNPVTMEYPGLPTENLASRVAQRDLRAMSITQKFTIRLDRRAWREFPGSVFRIRAEDRGLYDVIIRAAKIEYKSVEDGEEVVITGALDVFGLPASQFVTADDSSWTPPNVDPSTVTNYLVRELTYREFVLNAPRYTVDNLNSQDAALAVFAARPIPMALNYNILTRAGAAAYSGTTTQGFVPSGLLQNAIDAYDTDIEIYQCTDPDSFEEGMVIQFGSEMARVNTFTYDEETGTGTLNLTRGIIDTIPSVHAANERFFDISDLGTDAKDWLKNDSIDVKLQTVTSEAVMEESTIPVINVTMDARQYKPYAPGNVKFNAALLLNGVTASSEPAISIPGATTFTLSWAHRDRISQQDIIVEHTAGNVGPEPGTQYVCQILNAGMSVVLSATVSGASWTPDISGLAAGTYTVRLAATRDGVQSRAVYSRKFQK